MKSLSQVSLKGKKLRPIEYTKSLFFLFTAPIFIPARRFIFKPCSVQTVTYILIKYGMGFSSSNLVTAGITLVGTVGGTLTPSVVYLP